MDSCSGKAIIISLVFIIITLSLQVRIQQSDIANLREKNQELAEDNALYISQMMPLQRIQNGIPCEGEENNEYLRNVWRYKNTFGGKQ